MLIPRRCAACGVVGPSPCAACIASMRRAPALPPPPGVDRCASLVLYIGAAREVVARVKYRNARASVAWLATGMAALVDASSVDVVTWVPTTRARRRGRGFDQGRLLARAVARRLGLPCRSLLRRRPGPPQTGRALDERRRGPALETLPGRSVSGLRVLVVDDVVTSGASLATAARVLRNAGGAEVHAVTAARTPLKLRSPMTDAVSNAPPQSPPPGQTAAGRARAAGAVGAAHPA
ncbi:MAG: ComF family protein [Actinobacteria bacterium]|nr:ComF family protein [Actinomycetota bacterium]